MTPFLVEKMCAELEGILLWCLEGLHRLVQNDFRFTVSERAAANVDTIKRSSNNVIDFMESEGYFRFKADYSISSKEFYDIYKQWCEDNACHSVSAIRFSAELRQNDRRYNLEATNNIYLPRWPQGCGGFCRHRAACPPLSVKSAFFCTEEVRTTCTVCTCTHLYSESKRIKTCYRLYFAFLYAVQTVQVI